MTRPALAVAAALTLAACSAPLTPQQQVAGQEALTVAAALTPIAAQGVSDTQLLCQGSGLVYAIIDAASGKPVQVPGRTAQFVANVCGLVGAGVNPTALPAAVASVTPIAVVVPKA